MDELLPPSGAVHRGSFQQLTRHALESRQVDDHVVAHVPPDADEDDGPDRHGAVGGPGFVVIDAQGHEHLVDRSVLHQHEGPADAYGDHGGDVREEKDGPENHGAADFVQQDRQGQGADDGQRNGYNGVKHRVLQGDSQVHPVEEIFDALFRHLGGVENIGVVIESDEPDPGDIPAVPFKEGEGDGKKDGHQGKDGETQEVGRQEGIGDQRPSAPAPARGGTLPCPYCGGHGLVQPFLCVA